MIIVMATFFIPADDYMAIDQNVTFSSGSVIECISIVVIDDESLEDIQYFTLHLQSIDAEVAVENAITNISIIDNDSNLLNYTTVNDIMLSFDV